MPGALVDVGPAALATGGSVANTGLALHRLGVPTRLVGKVGADMFGRAIRELLHDVAPTLGEGLITGADDVSSYSVVLSAPGMDRIFLHCSGANHTFTAADIPANRFAGARILHFGYPPLMRGFYADGGQAMATLFHQARDTGMLTSLDMAQPDPHSEAGQIDWSAWLARVLPQVDIFAPSVDELLYMLDRPLWAARHAQRTPMTTTLLAELAEQVLDFGAAIVAIKLGDEGLYLRTTVNALRLRAFASQNGREWAAWWERELLVPCFIVDVVGTTGAGDATIAGLLAAILYSFDPVAAARHAVAVGACAVEQADATSGVPSWPTVQARLAAGWAHRPPVLECIGGRWDATEVVWYGPLDRLHQEQGTP
ncbi:MAG: carbohydrate kinase family protein [Roseiflexaceae bacterium]|nr:carbohydrate kinase family protein [Roseiflexaceae bacterium]